MKINFRMLFKILGTITLIGGLGMLPCFFTSLHYNEGRSSYVFINLFIFLTFIGIILFACFMEYKPKLKVNDGFFIATITWFYSCIIGMLPFLFLGYPFMGSLFESVAGFTTTGCSVLDIDNLPPSLILWRSMLNWLGGMGILVLVVSVFPSLGISGQSLALMETTGPSVQKIGARFTETGKFLYFIYGTFTVIEFILLYKLTPLGFFDSLVNTFSSLSTSGLYIRPENAYIFNSTSVKVIVLVFTLLSSINYTLYYLLIKKKFKEVIQDRELQVFLSIIVVVTLFISVSLKINNIYSTFGESLIDSAFQVVSFISTSGYCISDYNMWPTFAIVLLFSLLFIGGCSMSTTGSLKVIRIITIYKIIKRGVFKQIHPRATKAIVINKKALPAQTVSSITSHVILYLFVFIIGSILLSFNNLSMSETISASLGLFTNTGVMLGEAEVTGYFGIFNTFSQIVMCILMIAGRLEMYSVLILFTKSFWENDSANLI